MGLFVNLTKILTFSVCRHCALAQAAPAWPPSGIEFPLLRGKKLPLCSLRMESRLNWYAPPCFARMAAWL